jgi:hypothetical protein
MREIERANVNPKFFLLNKEEMSLLFDSISDNLDVYNLDDLSSLAIKDDFVNGAVKNGPARDSLRMLLMSYSKKLGSFCINSDNSDILILTKMKRKRLSSMQDYAMFNP